MPNPNRRRRLGQQNYPMLATRVTNAGPSSWSIADNAALSMGAGLDMTIAGWFQIAVTNAFTQLTGKWVSAGGTHEYLLDTRNLSGDKARFIVSNDGTAVTSATHATVMTLNAWHFLVATYDGTNIKVNMDNGTAASAAFSADIFDGVQNFTVGGGGSGDTAPDGLIDCLGVWKSARGGGGALSAAQQTQLYNNGIGMAYRDLPGNLRAALVAWWDFDGNGLDALGNSPLAPINNPSFVAGKR
jgi:hypothetical protein